MMLAHLAGIQQRNVRFAQDLVDRYIEELRDRVEVNREAGRQLADHALRQQEALRELLRESVDAYVDLLYAPLRHYGAQLGESGRWRG